MGMVALEPGTAIQAHYHKVEDVMIVLDGRGLFILEGEEHPIEAGMAIIAPAGKAHGLQNNSDSVLRIVYAWPSVDVERFFLDNPELT